EASYRAQRRPRYQERRASCPAPRPGPPTGPATRARRPTGYSCRDHLSNRRDERVHVLGTRGPGRHPADLADIGVPDMEEVARLEWLDGVRRKLREHRVRLNRVSQAHAGYACG